MGAHAKLSASGSDRWLGCPGSVALSEGVPEQPSGAYADEGTEAHKCHEFLLKNRASAKAVAIAESKWSDEMVRHALFSIDYIIDRKSKHAELLCETKIDLSCVGPDMFGTTDAAIVEEFGLLEVIDYKYGAGVAVDPEENTQMIYYAIGIADLYAYNFSRVKLTIIQPRAEHDRGPIRSWELDIADLIHWRDEVFKYGVALVNQPDAELKTGDWCRWCPAKPICPKLSTEALEQAQIDFEPEESAALTLPVVGMIKPDKIANILNAADRIETWITALREHALFVAKGGVKIPGFKVVQKRSTRKWADADKVAAIAELVYHEEAFERKLLSPAQFEKRVKTDGAANFVTKHSVSESSGVTLVSDSDSRPEFNVLEAEYDDVSAVTVTNTVGAVSQSIRTEFRKGEDVAKKKAAKKTTKSTTKKTTKTKKR